jgi:hypothetical protein
VTSRPASSLRSRYVEQAASDLEENRRRQRELTEKIAVLQQEEALLTDILSLAERYEGLPDASRPPATLQSESVPGQGRHVSGRQGRGTTRPGAEEKPRHPLLGDVLLDLLRGHDEPRLAKEIRDELLEKHPDPDTPGGTEHAGVAGRQGARPPDPAAALGAVHASRARRARPRRDRCRRRLIPR